MEKYIKLFIDEISNDKSKNTIEAYKRDLDKFVLYMRDREILDLEKISDVDVIMYFMNLGKEGNSKNSTVRYVAAIKSFFKFLHQKGLVKREVDLEKFKPKFEKKERDILSKKEFEKLINTINIGKNIGLRDKIIMLLMYYHGLKPTSLIELKLTDVDLQLGIIDINNKRVSINKELVSLIKAYVMISRKDIIKGKDSDYLFTGYGEIRLTRQSVWKIINKYRKLADIKKDITSNILHDSCRYHKVED